VKIAISGAGKVGRAIARDLIAQGHEVLLIDKDKEVLRGSTIDGAKVLLGDTCEPSVLDKAGLADCQVLVAATGDDKVNLVVSLLAKTEFGVPRVVARVNHPKNEWMFGEAWGVDVAVSTPRMLTALVEEAVSVGDLIRLMTFRKSDADLVEITLPAISEVVGERVGDVAWPIDTALVAILRDDRVIAPSRDDTLESGDELLFVASTEQEEDLARLLGGRAPLPQSEE
jgi:trk system potassium uptake protein TrkA